MCRIIKVLKTVTAASVLVVGLLLTACGTSVAEPAIPQAAGINSWYENGSGGRYVVSIMEGQLPATNRHAMAATVLTDSDCAPDAQGLNHCHNIIQFNDGTRISVIDNHQMSRHRCLKPGEQVKVSAMGPDWATVQTAW